GGGGGWGGWGGGGGGGGVRGGGGATVFPYTTLFRSLRPRPLVHRRRGEGLRLHRPRGPAGERAPRRGPVENEGKHHHHGLPHAVDRKSTRLNSSHVKTSYAVFCLQTKTPPPPPPPPP